jgi:hypothetical protein
MVDTSQSTRSARLSLAHLRTQRTAENRIDRNPITYEKAKVYKSALFLIS